MIRKLTLTTGLLALTALAFAPNVVAQTAAPQVVPFSGTVVSTCTFSNIVGGTLVNPLGKSWVEASGGIPGGTTGTAGTTTLSCSAGGSLSTAVPVKVAAPASFTPVVVQSLVHDGLGEYTQANTGGKFDLGIWNRNTTPIAIAINTNTDLTVAMVAGTRNTTTTGFVPSGTYTYNVTLTATPN